MSALQLILLVGTFIVSTVLFKIFISIFFNRGKYEKRLEKYVEFSKQNELEDLAELNEEPVTFVRRVAKQIESIFNLTKNEKLLIQSGIQLTQGELFIARILVAIIGMTVGYLYGLHLLVYLLCGWIGFYLPILYVKRKRKKRLNIASKQLGEALGTMANSLRAGFSFMQAMDLVAREIGEPLGTEFLKALSEINYGVMVEDAFENLLDRLPDKELEIVLNTLIVQRRTGGNLAFLLETMQETIFDRTRVKEEVNALTAQGKLSSVIITLLPIALAVYINAVNPEYFHMLFSHPVGWLMVISGSIGIVLGWIFINKIVQIEV